MRFAGEVAGGQVEQLAGDAGEVASQHEGQQTMTEEQWAEFVRVVDEMRRLQQVTSRPPSKQAARMLTLAEGTVDQLLMKYREPDPSHASSEHLN